jgi:membrane-bound metal-dependent hydrolase YbcI (DUF457 family)
MRTYTHGVIGYLLYANRSRREKRLAVIGGILPDVFLVTGFIPHYLETVTSSSIVTELHHLLHHAAWHIATVSMHSLIIVGSLLVLSYMIYKPALPCFVGMLAHGIVDLLTHVRWAYNHFFPIPLAPIEGIVSYTDMGVTIGEHALLLLAIVWWMRKRRQRERAQAK